VGEVLMVPPIIIVEEDCDVSVYTTVHDAEIAMEPIDVRNGIYTAYDSQGRLLRPIVEKKIYKPKKWWEFLLWGNLEVEVVALREAENEPLHADELRRILIDYLQWMKEHLGEKCHFDNLWLFHATLPDLIAKAADPTAQ
jgi:hypothetical protein